MYKKIKKDEKPPFKIENINFHYSLDVTYDDYRECQNGSDCCDGDYCRCGILQNMKVKENPTWEKIEYNLKLKNYSDLEKYLMDRILKNNKVYQKDNWEVSARGGYYGQEIGEIVLDWQIARKVEGQINEVLSMDDAAKQIEYVLNLEYGYILPGIENKTWTIENINKDLIKFGNEGHYLKIDQNLVSSYKEHTLPRGICLKDGEKYRVIDGYHRIMAGPKQVQIITELETK